MIKFNKYKLTLTLWILLISASTIFAEDTNSLPVVYQELDYEEFDVYDDEDTMTEAMKIAEKYAARVAISCLECRTLISTIQRRVEQGATVEDMETLAINVCENNNLFPDDVCEQMVYLSAPEVVYVVNYTDNSIATMCDTFFGVCEGNLSVWTVEPSGGKPTPSHPDPQDGTPSLKILHLTDTHFEPLYEEGTPTVCTHPLCCRPYGDPNDDTNTSAGIWGAESGDCDAPKRTLEAALESAAAHQPDIIYMTGDLPAHDVWAQTHDSILNSIDVTAGLIRQYFPDIPIAYALGNHEAAPVNSYAVPAVYEDGWDMDYLYEFLVDVWGDAGLPVESMDTVRTGGYYQWSPFSGLRVVSINCNYGQGENWFLMMDHVDPTGQLEWLSGVLQEAEEMGDKVHILGHIAPGGLMDSFSHTYNKLISRYESTITALFGGHSHDDQIKIQWDVANNTRPVAVTYIAPSISSNGEKSPSYRMYVVDGGHDAATWAVEDVVTYSMNLTLANLGLAPPDFNLSYTAKEAYNLQSLSPQSWAELVWQMATDDELFDEYQRHYWSFWEEPAELDTCDSDCREGVLCGIVSGDSTDREPCDRIASLVVSDTTTASADYL